MPKLQEPLRLYNMFPRSFRDFVAMREYVTDIAAMGFNVVWLNPLQEVTECETKDAEGGARNVIPVDDKIVGSLYAAKSFVRLNKEFIRYDEGDSEEEIQRKGKEQLKALVAEIKDQGMVPMFDLVLNHVAADSELLEQHKDDGFFMEGGAYHDVRDFNYAEKQDEIIERIWRPFIEKYAKEYGFEGVRVDAPFLFSLRNVAEARKKIYRILHENIEDPLIFEEWLFQIKIQRRW